MRFKQDVRRSLSVIESVYMNVAIELAEKLNEGAISYDELIQLREYYSMKRPDYYKVLFDMIEENLLRMGLEGNEPKSVNVEDLKEWNKGNGYV